MFAKTIKQCLASVVLGAVLTSCASPDGVLGEEWVAVEPENSRIVFLAADVSASHVRFFKNQAADHSYNMEYGSWSSESLPHGRAMLVYKELTSGYHYRQTINLKSIIESFGMADEFQINHGATIQAAHYGTLASQLFDFDNISCLAFSRNWGATAGRSSPDGGNKLLYGYFCADPGDALEADEIDYIRNSIAIR